MENPEPVEAPFWPAPAGSGEAVQAMLCVEGLQHWVVEHGRALQPEQWCDALFGREKLEDCLDAGGHVDDRTWNRIRQVDSAFRRNAALVIDAVGACGYSTERRSRFWRGLIACARWSGR